MMGATIGYHIVISGYGLWLPGDSRGSWSAAWDEQLGLVEPHALHPGDPVRLRMAEERAKHPAVRLALDMIEVVCDTFGRCAAESDWTIDAASVEPTHVHLLLTYSERDIDKTVKWLKDRCTKAVHQCTPHQGPVWCKGRWRSFIYEEDGWEGAIEYIERHNLRRGLSRRPYKFLAPRT
jgi:REP element-mobilizing transposase RayT